MDSGQNVTAYEFLAEWYGPWDTLFSARALWWRWVICIATVVSVGIGIPANILVFGAVMFFKDLQKLSHAFIINLAVCDSIVMLMDTFVFFGLILGQKFWDDRLWFCELSGTVCITSCFGSLWTMLMISVNRLVFVKNQTLYRKVFGKAGTVLSIILIWVFVYILDLPNALYVGLSSHRYNPAALHCDFGFNNWWYNTFFYTGFAFILPLTGVITCYVMIISAATKGSANTKLSEKRMKDQRQLVRSLIILLVTFVATWGPLALLYGVEYSLKAPFEVHLVLEVWAHFNSAINPLIYGFTHTGFRKAYKKMLNKVAPCLVGDPDLDPSSKSNITATSTAPSRTQNSEF